MEQDLDFLQGEIDHSDCASSSKTQMYIQLAQAEQLQGIRKALEGIVRAMKGPDFTMEVKSSTSGKAHVKHTRVPDMPEEPIE